MEQEQNGSDLTPVAATPEGTAPSSLSAPVTIEPWYTRMGWSIVESLLKLAVFLLGIILDVLKAIISIVVGIFVGIYKGAIAIYKFFRKGYRIFREVDWAGKLSFLIQGVGPIHDGQIVDGIIFMVIEALFILFLVTGGIDNIGRLGSLAPLTKKDTSVYVLIRGLVALFVCAAYLIVYILGIKLTYDDYQIVHNYDFHQARADQLNVLGNLDDYEMIDFKKDGYLKIRKIMRHNYGYSKLSARYISYVPFKRLGVHKENPIAAWWWNSKSKIHAKYEIWVTKVRAGKWASAWGRFLDWEIVKPESKYGYDAVVGEVTKEYNAFRHTYDKYNDYLATSRDLRSVCAVLSKPELILRSVYAEDEVSRSNNLTPIDHSEKVKAKDIVSRLVGTFEIPLATARLVARLAAKGIEKEKAGKGDALAFLNDAHDHYQKQLDDFVETYGTKELEAVHGCESAYRDYVPLRPFYDQGKAAFKGALVNAYHLTAHDAEMVYQDYALAIKHTEDSEHETREELLLRAEHYHQLVLLYENAPLHGAPVHFKKEIKMFADERFAVSVLALPVLGALLTCVIPLLFSIIIAFTNYDRDHTSGTFNWSWSAISQFFAGNGTGSTSIASAFGKILVWTLIWAFFATFTNYIFGIVLALLINKKDIKLKKMWRTLFVITIAIPQFITLLTMNLLLSKDGPVNAWLMTQTWYTSSTGLSHTLSLGSFDSSGTWNAWAFPFISGTGAENSDTIWPKMTLILVNMWIGIPYTMLSTSGILMNIPEDLYESSRIDGAGAWTQFWKITMPYVIFVTGPSLLTTFIGNINNFNVIFFLTGGGPTVAGRLSNAGAGNTDLLITWLYKLTVNKYDYATASVIGIAVFLVCSFFSLIVYGRLGSTQNEEEFQ